MIWLLVSMNLAGASPFISHTGSLLMLITNNFTESIHLLVYLPLAPFPKQCVSCYVFRWNGESLRESIKRHEHFLALQLGLKPGDKVDFPFF